MPESFRIGLQRFRGCFKACGIAVIFPESVGQRQIKAVLLAHGVLNAVTLAANIQDSEIFVAPCNEITVTRRV